MRYYRFSIRTIPAAEDLIVSAMEEIGLTGAQIEDNVPLTAAEKEQIYTYDVDDPVDDNRAVVSFYAEEGTDAGGTKERIAGVLDELKRHTDIGSGEVIVSVTDDEDWLNNWKQFFHRFFIGEDILVIPSWEEADKEELKKAEYVLHIDPGTAFGTGAHETTQLAALSMRDMLREGMRVLDIGTGSGILGILALMFGAGEVCGVDVDPFTKDAVEMNLKGNAVDKGAFRFLQGNLIEDEEAREAAGGDYDIVLANILPVVLKPLTPYVPRFVKKGGYYITSGILAEKVPEMRRVIEDAGFEVLEVRTQGEWCAVCARMP